MYSPLLGIHALLFVICIEVVPISESPFREVPLYLLTVWKRQHLFVTTKWL